ncbi:MAG TPA: hypothetical protein VNX02_14905 [Steroidobacteraceae bacterium]|jgi:hypothetical protein|nr:hypothetical protein [Steroidobacteraceae bacterium]
MRQPTPSLILVLAVGLAVVAAGCGSGSQSSAPSKAVKAPAARKPVSPIDQLSPNLVPAVATSKVGASLVELKFELAAPPAIGTPVDIDLVIVPTGDTLDRLSGTIQGDDGLEVLSGGTIDPVDRPPYGTPIHHALKVVARRDGIYTLSANLSVDSGGQTLTPVFSMPVIGGNGLGDAPAAPTAAPGPARTGTAAVTH